MKKNVCLINSQIKCIDIRLQTGSHICMTLYLVRMAIMTCREERMCVEDTYKR